MPIDYLQLIIDAAVGKDLKILPLYQKHAVVQMILNNKDWEKYLYVKQRNGNAICRESIKSIGDVEFQAKTLMESKGWYYIVLDDINQIDYFS